MQRVQRTALFIASLILATTPLNAKNQKEITEKEGLFSLTLRAEDKFERSDIANSGASIEELGNGVVQVIADIETKQQLQEKFKVISSQPLTHPSLLDFPARDADFHNFEELKTKLNELHERFPKNMELKSLSRETHEERSIPLVILSDDLSRHAEKPAVMFVGGHHAREHLSVETPLLIAERILQVMEKDSSRLATWMKTRTVYIVPSLNPDGATFDVHDDEYHYWRKNRRQNHDGSYGVDLNRNYPFEWGESGASSRPRSQTYHGPSALSEPETQAFAQFLESHDNITTLLSFHTYSELILYPWGHSYDPLSDRVARQTHMKMARTMAQWNNYDPMQASELYQVSGELTDYSYGELGIISFTFELDPSSPWEGGFYPGQEKIDVVFEKNWPAAKYLIENCPNPYGVLQTEEQRWGLESPWGSLHLVDGIN